ncbi:hypothetical protein [Desulfoluna spongiiphila]|nr:hypothetical protein [Desulfoluna spongiiphila]
MNSSLLHHALAWFALGGCVAMFLGAYGFLGYGGLLGISMAVAAVGH